MHAQPDTGFFDTVQIIRSGVLYFGYVALMAITHTTTEALVTVHREGSAIAIIAAPGWTEQDWDAAVPDDLNHSYLGAWDYREIDGYECWIIDTKSLDRP